MTRLQLVKMMLGFLRFERFPPDDFFDVFIALYLAAAALLPTRWLRRRAYELSWIAEAIFGNESLAQAYLAMRRCRS